MMASENESIESIVTEMRRREKSHYYPKVARNIMRQYAGRIEAAWEREREELDKRISDLEAYAKLWTGRADELRLKCDELYAKAKPVGNAAALREALREAIGETCAGCKRDCDDCMNLKSGWMKKAKAALSAPPRNCDVGTAEEQGERCMAQFDQWRRKGDGRKLITAIMAWAQMPCEALKGGAK